jgi:hypothetical protein
MSCSDWIFLLRSVILLSQYIPTQMLAVAIAGFTGK